MMPIDLLLVRHGESEGNVAMSLSRKGDDRYFTPEFRNRHSSSYRLTPQGEAQAMAAGAWIRDNVGSQFDRRSTMTLLRSS